MFEVISVFSDINISQGSVATRLRCGGTFYCRFSRNLLPSLSVKKVWNCLSFGKVRDKNRVFPFFRTQCIFCWTERLIFVIHLRCVYYFAL